MQFRDLHKQYEAMRTEMDEALLTAARSDAAVNTFPGFVHTARQTMKVGNTRSL